MAQQGSAKPDWYADPTGRHQHRYWDGSAWTANVADSGEASVDPLDTAASDSSTGHKSEPEMTLATLVREFVVRNEDDIRLQDLEWIRNIVNSGCAPDVLQGASWQSGMVVHKFMTELAEQGFIERVPWNKSGSS